MPWWFPYGPEGLDGFHGIVGAFYGDGLVERATAVWRHRRGLAHIVKRYL